jgi:Amidohydrolase family
VLRRQPGQPVPLVVAGQAQAEVVHRHPRSAGEPALLLVAVTGLDAQPIYAWVSDEPGHPLFALLNIGWALIRDGQAALAPELLRRQQAVDDERLFRLRREMAQPLHGLTLIRAVRWFDAKAATLKGPSDVWLLNGRIWRITAPGAWSAQADQVIEGTVDGKAGGTPRTLLPGLFDMHGHLTREDLILHLAGGVTTVRDQGNTNGDLLRMKARVEAGLIIGPHIVPSGFIEGQSDFASQTGSVVDSVEAGRAAVDWYHARGYRAIKLYNSIRPEWVKPLAAHAKSLGLRVTGHVPAFMRAGQAVDAGFDELTHINQVMLNFVMREGDDTRTLTRFTRVGDESHAVKLSEPRVQAFLRQIGSRKLSVDPTLVAFEAMFTQSPGEENPSFLDIKPNLPATWQRRSRVAEMEITGERLERNRASFQRMLELTRAMHRSGARIVPGTDSLAGLGLHQELALYVRAGLSPAEALRSATWVSAEVAGELKERGSIEMGKRADLILVDGDPTRDVLQLRRTSLVLTDGVAYSPAALYRAVGFKPFVEGATVSTTDGADSAGRSGGGRHRHQHHHHHHHH